MSEYVWVSVITFFGIILTVAIYFFIYRGSKLEREKSVIIGIIKDFIDPTIDKLKIDSKICGFEFPNSLDYSFVIISEDDAYKRFLRRRFLWLIKWKIKRYIEYYDGINEKVIKLAEKVKKQKLVEEINNVYGHSRILLIKYKLMNGRVLDKLLQEHGLIDDIKEIEELTEKIAPKAKNLAKKLEKLRDKWKERYNIV